MACEPFPVPIRALTIGFGIVLAALLLVVAHPAAAAVSFAGKRITMLISFPPGGGTDAAARLIGRTLARYLPGNPTMIFQNMPGADGITALNHFYAKVEPDGLTLISGAGNQLSPTNLQRADVVKYDPTRLALIGGLANDSSYLLLRKSAIPRLTNHAAAPVMMGDLDGTRSSAQMALWGAEALRWNVKWVLGYAGTADLLLALDRGEVDMAANNNPSGLSALLASGEVAVYAQTGMLVDGRIVPTGLFPDVPILADLVAGKLTGPSLQTFLEWQQEAQIGKWFALPPLAPAPIVETYRAAFDALFDDGEFRDNAARQIGPDARRMSVADLDGLIKSLAGTSPQTLETMQALRKKYGL
jgi:tripartite-type tricarboxylate transporter receptor subunit TctC